jgi:hypothetical protein
MAFEKEPSIKGRGTFSEIWELCFMGNRALETAAAAADLTAYDVGEGVLFNGIGVTVSGGGMDFGESCSIVATLLS